MTWKVVTEKTQKVLCWSAIRNALDPSMRNLSLDPLKSTDFKMLPSSPTDKPTTAPSLPPNPDFYEENKDNEVVYFRNDGEKSDGTSHKFKYVITNANGEPKRDENGEIMYRVRPHPEELSGMNFRIPDPDTGLPTHITIDKLINDYDDGLRKNKVRQSHFEVKYSKDDRDDIMSYNDIVEFLRRDTSLYDGQYWHLRKIIGHEETPQNHMSYKGSSYNVRELWENGEITSEALKIFAKDAPVECAMYAKENGLLNKPGWKRFRRLDKRESIHQLVQQAKLRSFCTTSKYKFGYEITRDYKHEMELDAAAGKHRLQEVTQLEMDQVRDYDIFIDKGEFNVSKIPRGFQRLQVMLTFDVKHDGRHKVRLVARGDLTDTPVDSVYAGVVSLRGFCMCLFLAKLNEMEVYTTGISNAYLEAYTTEKLCIHAGKEFDDQQDHLLIVSKSLYGLYLSSRRFNETLGRFLSKLGFERSKCEDNI